MSHSVYNLQWQRAMEQLSHLINEENPPPKFDDKKKPIPVSAIARTHRQRRRASDDPPIHTTSSPIPDLFSLCRAQAAPITFYEAYVHSASLYLKYLTVFRQLEDSYDQIIHPQKRKDIRLTLELVMARVCQLRHDLLLYSASQPSAFTTPGHCHLEPFLAPLHLSPADLEVPIPRYFTERSDDAEERKKREIVERLCEENAVMWGTAGLEVGLVSEEMTQQLSMMNRLTKEQAIRIIQKNERGRQGAMRARLMKELREEDARKRQREAGQAMTRDSAATLIQKTWRGYWARKRTREEELEELIFLGMKPSPNTTSQQTILTTSQQPVNHPSTNTHSTSSSALPKYDPLVKEYQIRQQRKTRQLDAALAFSDALRTLETELEAVEGDEMKERLWNERYDWWVAEKEKTGQYPLDLTRFYTERYPNSEEAKAAEAAEGKKKGKAKGSTPAKAEAKEDKGKAKDAKGKDDKAKDGKKAPPLEGAVDPNELIVGPSVLVAELSACVRSYAATWLGKDESGNPDQSFDAEMAKAELRPQVERRIQRAVDERLALYFENIREKVAENAPSAKKGKAGKGKTKEKKEAGKDEGKVEESKEQLSERPASSESSSQAQQSTSRDDKGKDGGKAKAAAKKCCEGDKLCSHLTLHDMIALLIKMNILQALPTAALTLPVSAAAPPPATSLRLAALQGDVNLVAGQQAAAALAAASSSSSSSASSPASLSTSTPLYLEPSFQQLRSFFTERFILPLGSAFVHSTQPSPSHSLLLYGPSGSGKTMVARAIAHESGSVYFDLSARNVEKKLGTKAEIAKLVHLVFTVARELQPAVMVVDEVDRVFGSAKSKKSAGELVKLRALLVQHAQALERNDRVLLIGCCRVPYSERVDVKELLDLFGPPNHTVLMPLPDFLTRRKLWAYFIQQTGLTLTQLEKNPRFDLTTLALCSEGYTAGAIQQAALSTLPSRRVAKLLEVDRGVDSTELIAALSQTSYVYKGEYERNVAWFEQVSGVKERRKMKELADAKERGAQEEEIKPNKKK